MAFDEVRAQTRQASSRSRHCSSLGESLVTTRQRLGTRSDPVRLLDEEATVDLAQTKAPMRRGRRRDHSHVLPLVGEAGEGDLVEAGGDQDVCERALEDLFREQAVDVAAERHDARRTPTPDRRRARARRP